MEMESGWRVFQLKLNGLEQPAAVDPDQAIYFSWELGSSKCGDKQNDYRVTVSECGRRPNDRIWDSGIVRGSADQQVLYTGGPLQSGKRYLWFVNVWNEDGAEATAASEFGMGLRPGDWSAKWIWKPGAISVNDYALFRKTFRLESAPVRATLFASAQHYFKLFVNGRRISGIGSPAPTTPPQTKYYLTYDVTPWLVAGDNTVSAVVHYLGGGGQNNVNGFPGLICRLEKAGTEGEIQFIGTDETWEVCRETPYTPDMPHQQNRRLSAVEQFDGRIALRTTAWLEGSDDQQEPVPPIYAVASAIETDSTPWILKPQHIPEGRVEKVIRPERCGIQRIGQQVFDTGSIVSGWVKLSLKGYPFKTIRVRYAEQVEADGSLKHHVCNEHAEYYYDEYIMNGSLVETWRPDFAYKAFRYFEITGYPDWIREEDLEVEYAHTPLGPEGRFECSDPLLNAMFQASIQSQKNNVLGQVVDCPHREQAQYLADSDLQAEVLTCFFEARQVLHKVLTDFKDTLQPDGSFPFVAPCSFNLPEFHVQIPEWDLHFISLLWKVYFTYDDPSIVKECYGTAAALTNSLLAGRHPDTGLLPKGNRWHISDWPYPAIDHDGPYLTVYNMKFFRSLGMMSRLARIMGLQQDEERFEAAACQLKEDLFNHLYDAERKQWRDCYGSDSCSQGTNALALRCRLTPEPDRGEAISLLTRKWECRTVLSLELFRLLFEEGEQETAMEWLSREEYPGWGYMIAQGSKTMWEGFEDIESHSHAWNGYPARLFADYLLGVSPLRPGYARVAISPYFSPKLTYAKGSVRTVRGNVQVRWERKGENIGLFISLPAGVTAEVSLANDSPPLLLESGSHYMALADFQVR